MSDYERNDSTEAFFREQLAKFQILLHEFESPNDLPLVESLNSPGMVRLLRNYASKYSPGKIKENNQCDLDNVFRIVPLQIEGTVASWSIRLLSNEMRRDQKQEKGA